MIVGLPAADGNAVEVFSDTTLGNGMLLPPYVPSQLYLAHSWGGACARGAVGGGRQAVVRLLQGPFAHGSTWGGEVGKTYLRRLETAVVCSECLVLDGRPGVLLPGWPTVGCNFRGNG